MAAPNYNYLPVPTTPQIPKISSSENGLQFPTFTQYDQFPQLNFAANRGQGGIQSAVQGVPLSQYGRPLGQNVRFEDVLAPLFNQDTINRPFTGQEYLERGLNVINPGEGGIDPVTQRILNLIDSRTATARTTAASEASALASRRGLAGSSIEQFGVQQGIEGAERVGAEQVQSILQQAIQNQLALRTEQAQGLFKYAGGEQEIGAQFGLGQLDAATRARLQAGQLTSDELASIRNIQENNLNRALQERLGAAGINQAYDALSVSQTESAKDRKQSEKNAIIGGVGDVVSAFPF